ncbi:kynureninase [Flexibacterium corallicola]|uniref:kynureninase n=1 Tax=Flexibacterium corallicola TaxID=3037259 RepID=UPI00286F7885|nr:kynureninase [Pseudovibrio sp. M1P-2-3]
MNEKLPRKELFSLPESVIYLDGNSLGVLPKGVSQRLKDTVENEWGRSLITGWNEHSWIDMPECVGDKIGRLVGAPSGTVIASDSTSINVFKVLSAALNLRPERKVILSDTGNFPTDLYVAQGLVRLREAGYELRLVKPEDLLHSIDESIAVVLVTEVDYRTGRRHNMKDLTAAAHNAGALTLWDLAHSAGAFPVYLEECQADFAVGCGYKYLNGGPGAPAFLYVSQRHQSRIDTPLSGWMGHEAPFAFQLDYAPAAGVNQMRVGTPPVLALSALDAALDVFDGVCLEGLWQKSVVLSELFIEEVEARCPELELVSPRDSKCRGSQVSFKVAEGYAVMQALIAGGVIGDFRAPDIIRFGFTPLYLDEEDILKAAKVLQRVMGERLWDNEAFYKKAKVT